MPIDYGKIRVLNVTKSAKKRAENLGVTVQGNPRVLITCRLSLAQSSSEENPPTHTKSKRFQKQIVKLFIEKKDKEYEVHFVQGTWCTL
jgi:hypothetical protein